MPSSTPTATRDAGRRDHRRFGEHRVPQDRGGRADAGGEQHLYRAAPDYCRGADPHRRQPAKHHVTPISSGATLQIGNGGATGSLTGNVTNGGLFIINRSNAYTFDGVISGTGLFVQMGAGTTTLTATNTYTGGTTIPAGTLAVSADANLGNTSGGLSFGGG